MSDHAEALAAANAVLRAAVIERDRQILIEQRTAIENEIAWQRAQDEIRLLRAKVAVLADALEMVRDCSLSGCWLCKKLAESRLLEEVDPLPAWECHCLDGLPQSFRDEVAFMQRMAKWAATQEAFE